MQGRKLSAVMSGASFFFISIQTYLRCMQSYPFGYGKRSFLVVTLHCLSKETQSSFFSRKSRTILQSLRLNEKIKVNLYEPPSNKNAFPPPQRPQREIPKDERTKIINICKEMTRPKKISASSLGPLHYFCLSLFPKYKYKH